jgi:hypothetical protein
MIWNHDLLVLFTTTTLKWTFHGMINTMKFCMEFGINSWCDGMNSYHEIYVLNSYMKYMYELIMWTKWTKDRDREQEVCPHKWKVEQVLWELLQCSSQTSSRHRYISYIEFTDSYEFINSYTKFIVVIHFTNSLQAASICLSRSTRITKGKR